ncbi:MAG TPA: NAD(P)(+) transhydrogenase (Re/Si-specific) subunit beta, partial [Tepidisphaeraceae bacterium]|nr:NAD(P)(+) transhydrogenase (Re/Si-specific) subunit beta [Tepidisphaeraceae bacterium]
GIKGMTHPRTAVRGNLLSAAGMLLAIIATPLTTEFNWWIVIVGLVVGAVIGATLAIRVRMTAMPQMVALLNGFGGGASTLVAAIAAIGAMSGYAGVQQAPGGPTTMPLPPTNIETVQSLVAIALSGLIGAVTFWGSLVAWGKLEELDLFKRDLRLPFQQAVNAALLVVALALGALLVVQPSWAGLWYVLLAVVASVLGVLLVNRIGGADMPVVISLLNSYSGLAGATTGFVINNNVLIITGALVGASGIILTQIMCKAMNRSLANVLFGGIDSGGATASADEVYGGKVKSTTAEEIAMLLDSARRVVIVPGYGMAVSQAQHAVYDLYKELMDRGVDVQFAIHPVAGRMPGHMNVLLAEVNIPYERMQEMDRINPQMKEFDVAIVIGANDVVNPDARTNPNSPIAGMPILNVDQCRTVVVIKRSLSPGFAGIPNPLFAADNCLMYFADGKKAVLDIVMALKEM